VVFGQEDQEMGAAGVHVNGRIDRSFGAKGFLSASGGYSDGNFEYMNLGVLGDYFLDLRSHYLRGDLAWGPVHLRTFWNSEKGVTGPWAEAVDTAHSLNADLDADAVDVEIEANGDVDTGTVKHRLNGGIGYRYKHTLFTYLAGDDVVLENHFDAFMQEEATISKLKLVGSLRVDKHPLITDITKTISPRGAAIYRIAEDTSVRLTGGTAFRAPNQVENYMDFNLSTGIDGVYVQDFGSADLLPERILTAELGLHDESTAFHTADLTVYVNRLTDIIFLDSVTAAESPEFYDVENTGFSAGTTGWINTDPTYTGYGLEAETELFPTDGLDLYANLAIQQIMETSEGVTERDASTSVAKVNLGASYRTPWRIDVSTDAHYVSGQVWGMREFDDSGAIEVTEYAVAPRLILSARIAGRPFRGEDLELAAALWNFNAGDGIYEHPNGQPVRSRVYGSATYRF
jgi:outer membrane receptor protein involved in Fe transport